MVFSTFQFLITSLLAVLCALTVSATQQDISLLALLIPVMWVFPQRVVGGIVLMAAVSAYGLTLPYQPISLSLSHWILFPLLMVVFSRRSSVGVLVTVSLVVVTLQVGVMITQAGGKLTGEPMMTLVQALSVTVIWWAVQGWPPSEKHCWWALGLILPLWLTGYGDSAVVALCLTGIVGCVQSIRKAQTFNWSKLLCWTLPTVSFATLVVTPWFSVPNPVFVVWVCLLGAAWMTDYVLRSFDEETEL
ncbi:hypothetical protein GCM10007938_20070 [Vibrio zhanjiangensis]|uniref:Integral membrane protein n=1 Tax=Vibrio zhanjiangensis TaxID=1046128 RepID=A0ABQ6EZM9_9VIBR|nr:hypothetical protein [Vibrio zhanjiangensis]GLT18229.1 hypothetical protein GCM10007938_20070 [Vibrio zhanjiangensis]